MANKPFKARLEKAVLSGSFVQSTHWHTPRDRIKIPTGLLSVLWEAKCVPACRPQTWSQKALHLRAVRLSEEKGLESRTGWCKIEPLGGRHLWKCMVSIRVKPFQARRMWRKAMFLNEDYSLWRTVLKQPICYFQQDYLGCHLLDTHHEAKIFQADYLFFSPPSTCEVGILVFFFPITWQMRRLRFENLMWISPQELGAEMKIQTWPLHHCLVPALINISYCLYKMILSAWWESVLARNCNLIPVVIPHLLGSVNPIYVINGEMGLSKPNMHGKAENVMKGMKGPGGSNRERWRLRKTRKPMLIQRGQNYCPNPLLSL